MFLEVKFVQKNFLKSTQNHLLKILIEGETSLLLTYWEQARKHQINLKTTTEAEVKPNNLFYSDFSNTNNYILLQE